MSCYHPISSFPHFPIVFAMRIAIFSESYEPVQNGVSISVRTLVDELRARHNHVFIIAPHYPNYADSPFVLRVPSLLTPLNPDYALPYPWFPRLRRDFRHIAPDILHSHSPFFLGLLASRLARQYGIPLVSTYHTLYTHYGHYLFFLPQQATKSLLEWWIPEYYNRCACVIVPSKAAEESLRQYRVHSRIVVIPTAVPRPSPEAMDEAARQAARARFHIPLTAPLLLWVGRVAQEKNLELVLDAFDSVAAEFREARLLVIGGGPHLEAMRKRASEMETAERIVMPGPVPREELDPVFAAADLFIFGSTTETQGLVVAEARAAGTPCVVVNEGGAAETVRDGEDGLIVPPEREPFAAAVRSLLQNEPRRMAMREACLRHAKDYTPSAMADRVLEIYAWAREHAHSEPSLTNSR
jgi:1,2-diacylglycerol 3-alpha-glucosyltransferase